MNKKSGWSESPPHAQWLPIIDWNVKLYGAHRQKVKKRWRMPEESHIGFEMIFILDGVQETIMEKNRYLLHPGDIILIPPGFKHVNACISEQGMTYFCAHFHVDDPLFRIEMIKNDRILFPSGTDDNVKFLAILNKWMLMLKPDNDYTTSDRFRLQSLLFELFGLLAQIAGKSDQLEEAVSPATVRYAKAIAEAVKALFNPHHLDDEQMQSFRIEDIVSSLGISPGYGFEVFRKVYGISPRRYLSELKLNEAKVLIQQPDLALKDIAARLGYAHLSHFSRQFKRWTGMSPLQYRQSIAR